MRVWLKSFWRRELMQRWRLNTKTVRKANTCAISPKSILWLILPNYFTLGTTCAMPYSYHILRGFWKLLSHRWRRRCMERLQKRWEEKSCSSDNLKHIPFLTVFLTSCINLPFIVNCFQVAEEMNQPKVLELLRAASRWGQKVKTKKSKLRPNLRWIYADKFCSWLSDEQSNGRPPEDSTRIMEDKVIGIILQN